MTRNSNNETTIGLSIAGAIVAVVAGLAMGAVYGLLHEENCNPITIRSLSVVLRAEPYLSWACTCGHPPFVREWKGGEHE